MKTFNQLIDENFFSREQADIKRKSKEKIATIRPQQFRKLEITAVFQEGKKKFLV